ncbi:homeobox protein Hox-B4a-like, partial [Menidia menidia]
MAMSSYLINSNYVDPKFPPCEEYSQSDYLPTHSPDYYGSQRQDPAAFQSDSVYLQPPPRTHAPARAEQPYTPCQRAAPPASVLMSPRGHVVLPAGLQTAPGPEQSRLSDPVSPSPPPAPSCDQTAQSKSASSPPSARTDPVVYPW